MLFCGMLHTHRIRRLVGFETSQDGQPTSIAGTVPKDITTTTDKTDTARKT